MRTETFSLFGVSYNHMRMAAKMTRLYSARVDPIPMTCYTCNDDLMARRSWITQDATQQQYYFLLSETMM